jgi:hypothetical protein
MLRSDANWQHGSCLRYRVGCIGARPIDGRISGGDEMAYRKTAQASAPVAARGILTRVNPAGLKALRQLALDRDTTVQALMIEAANDLLRKYKRRPVAQTAR